MSKEDNEKTWQDEYSIAIGEIRKMISYSNKNDFTKFNKFISPNSNYQFVAKNPLQGFNDKNEITSKRTRLESKFCLTLEKRMLLGNIKNCEYCGIEFLPFSKPEEKYVHLENCAETARINAKELEEKKIFKSIIKENSIKSSKNCPICCRPFYLDSLILKYSHIKECLHYQTSNNAPDIEELIENI